MQLYFDKNGCNLLKHQVRIFACCITGCKKFNFRSVSPPSASPGIILEINYKAPPCCKTTYCLITKTRYLPYYIAELENE